MSKAPTGSGKTLGYLLPAVFALTVVLLRSGGFLLFLDSRIERASLILVFPPGLVFLSRHNHQLHRTDFRSPTFKGSRKGRRVA